MVTMTVGERCEDLLYEIITPPASSQQVPGFKVFSEQILKVDSATMAVNYGLNKVRFTNPVPAGGKVRLDATLKDFEKLPKGGVQLTVDGRIELEGSERPAVVVEVILRYFEE